VETYVLDQSALVLEGVTLAQVVQFVVEVLVNLARGTVLDQEAAKNTLAAHPQDLAGHSGVLGTLPLTQTTVSADPASSGELTGTGAGVHDNRLADDEAIADQLADRLTGVGVGDLVDLVRVEPHFALSAADHGGREALLGTEVDPISSEKKNQLAHN
jgi:hypothetical protein